MATWLNALTGEVFDLSDQPPEGAARSEVARHRRLVDTYDRSTRWERLDLPDGEPDDEVEEEQQIEGGESKKPADMTVVELRALAKERGVSTAGSKAELIERLSG